VGTGTNPPESARRRAYVPARAGGGRAASREGSRATAAPIESIRRAGRPQAVQVDGDVQIWNPQPRRSGPRAGGRRLGWWLGAMRLANRHTRMGRGHQPRRVANQRTRTWLLACSSQVRTARAECFAETTTRQRPQTRPEHARTHDGKSSSSRPCRRRRLRAFPVMAA
jgi:hypothetical protein